MSSLFYLQTLKCCLFVEARSPVRKMIRDIGVSNRRSLGFVQIWQERGGEEGKGRANSKAGQGRICRRRTIGQNQFPQSATRALSQNISICLFPHDISREAIMKLQSPNNILLGTKMFQLQITEIS